MIIFWMRKNEKDQPPQTGEIMAESFRKHDEFMKKFRGGHVKREGGNPEDFKWTESMYLVRFPPVRLTCNSQN
ncbi:MAG: hypothetical protein PHR43_05580 [Dehalococcoidales bacterium]|nr:hypothetical protein [Dehalococcoidales bacterium]